MTHRDFCYWIKGFLEIGKPETLTKEQIEEINKHLGYVFQTPSTTIVGGALLSSGSKIFQGYAQQAASIQQSSSDGLTVLC